MTDEWQQENTESPSRIIFDTFGDEFIGVYEGTTTIANPKGDDFDQLLFRGTDGNLYSTNPGYKLTQAFDSIKVGTKCKLRYVKDVPVGQDSPMKDIVVFTAKK